MKRGILASFWASSGPFARTHQLLPGALYDIVLKDGVFVRPADGRMLGVGSVYPAFVFVVPHQKRLGVCAPTLLPVDRGGTLVTLCYHGKESCLRCAPNATCGVSSGIIIGSMYNAAGQFCFVEVSSAAAATAVPAQPFLSFSASSMCPPLPSHRTASAPGPASFFTSTKKRVGGSGNEFEGTVSVKRLRHAGPASSSSAVHGQRKRCLDATVASQPERRRVVRARIATQGQPTLHPNATVAGQPLSLAIAFEPVDSMIRLAGHTVTFASRLLMSQFVQVLDVMLV